jgi:hypothetical protein
VNIPGERYRVNNRPQFDIVSIASPDTDVASSGNRLEGNHLDSVTAGAKVNIQDLNSITFLCHELFYFFGPYHVIDTKLIEMRWVVNRRSYEKELLLIVGMLPYRASIGHGGTAVACTVRVPYDLMKNGCRQICPSNHTGILKGNAAGCKERFQENFFVAIDVVPDSTTITAV